jgi:hypothetical protein
MAFLLLKFTLIGWPTSGQESARNQRAHFLGIACCAADSDVDKTSDVNFGQTSTQAQCHAANHKSLHGMLVIFRNGCSDLTMVRPDHLLARRAEEYFAWMVQPAGLA